MNVSGIPLDDIASMYEYLQTIGVADQFPAAGKWLRDGPVIYEPMEGPRYVGHVWDTEKQCQVSGEKVVPCMRVAVVTIV